MAISRVMSLQHCYNIRMSTGVTLSYDFSLMNLSRDFILCYDFVLRVHFYNLINYAKMKVYLDNFVDKTSVIFI